MDRADVYAVGLRYPDFCQPGGEHRRYLPLPAIEGALARSFGAAETHTLGLLAGESFLCALADELALDFGGNAESEGKHFAGYVVAEAVVVLDRPDLGPDFHAAVEDGHYHEEGAAKTAYLGTDDDVVLANTLEQLAETALAYILCAADSLAYPFVNLQAVGLAELVYLETLVLDCLPVRADTDITVYHTYCFLDFRCYGHTAVSDVMCLEEKEI